MSIPPENETLHTLVARLRHEAHPFAVSVTLAVTADTETVTVNHRSPETLRRTGVSMRNLRGEWIMDHMPPPPPPVLRQRFPGPFEALSRLLDDHRHNQTVAPTDDRAATIAALEEFMEEVFGEIPVSPEQGVE